MFDDQGGFPSASGFHLDLTYPAGGSVTEALPDSAPIPDKAGKAGGLSTGAEAMERVVLYLREHVREDVPMQTLAGLVRLSLRQFHRKFKQAFGMPPNQFHIQMRVKAASDLLITDLRPIAEIADALGFSDDTLFIRQFKSRMGVTPLQYRKSKR